MYKNQNKNLKFRIYFLFLRYYVAEYNRELFLIARNYLILNIFYQIKNVTWVRLTSGYFIWSQYARGDEKELTRIEIIQIMTRALAVYSNIMIRAMQSCMNIISRVFQNPSKKIPENASNSCNLLNETYGWERVKFSRRTKAFRRTAPHYSTDASVHHTVKFH